MAKRANGEGTLSRRKDKAGKTVGWRAAVTVGINEDGTQDRRWVSGKTQAEVQEKLRAFQADMHTGMVADTEGLTVSAYMARWADHKEQDAFDFNPARVGQLFHSLPDRSLRFSHCFASGPPGCTIDCKCSPTTRLQIA